MIYTHIHKVSNYFAVCGPPVGQQYVYHAGRRWTTDGPPVANLTIFLCNKIQNSYFWKVIHLKQMNLSQDSLSSRSVKTNAVPPLVHQLSIALTDDSCMCQTKTNSAIVLGCIKKTNFLYQKEKNENIFL